MAKTTQTHHLIPKQAFKAYGDFLDTIGVDLNNASNLFELPAGGQTGDSGFAQHNGSHPGYTNFVLKQIEGSAGPSYHLPIELPELV